MASILVDLPEPGHSLVQWQGPLLILAHGAGAPRDSDWLTQVTTLLVTEGIGVVRFEFPYMQQQRLTGKRRPPDRQPVLLDYWRHIVDQVQAEFVGPLWLGGKSMGGRMATLVVDSLPVAGSVILGYPFHPVGKPQQPRVEALQSLVKPCLIVQGTRDPLGNRERVSGYPLSASIELAWLEDGDHDFKPRRSSGFSQSQHQQQAASVIQRFINKN